MATTDTDHLPFRTVTGADSFNTWRRITNSIGQNASTGISTGHGLVLAGSDWSDRIQVIKTIPPTLAGETLGSGTVITGSSFDATDAVYDETHGGVRISGNSRQFMIMTKIPIDPDAMYRIDMKVKNLRAISSLTRTTDVETFSYEPKNLFYAAFQGCAGEDKEFAALREDGSTTYNYNIASAFLRNKYDTVTQTVDGAVTDSLVIKLSSVTGVYMDAIVNGTSIKSPGTGDINSGNNDTGVIGSTPVKIISVNTSTNEITLNCTQTIPSGETLTFSSDGYVHTFSGCVQGYNIETPTSADGGVGSRFKFDPGSKFANIIILNHHPRFQTSGGTPSSNPAAVWQSTADDIVIQSISIEKYKPGFFVRTDQRGTGSANSSSEVSLNSKVYIDYNEPDRALDIGSSMIDADGVEASSFQASRSPVKLFVNGGIYSNGGLFVAADTPISNANCDHFWSDDSNSSTHPGNGNGSWRFTHDNTLYANNGVRSVVYGKNKLNSGLHAGNVVMDREYVGNPTAANGIINSFRSPIYIGQEIDFDNVAGGKQPIPLLNLCVGSNNAGVGSGVAIDFYNPDSTGSETRDIPMFNLDNTELAARIATVHTHDIVAESHSKLAFFTGVDDDGDDTTGVSAANNIKGHKHDLIEGFALTTMHSNSYNSTTGKNPSSQNFNYLQIGHGGVPCSVDIKSRQVHIGDLEYMFPSSRSGAEATPATRVLASDANGNLTWAQLSATATYNQTVFNRSEVCPVGSVVAYSGPGAIPAGWATCDGASVNSTFVSTYGMDVADVTALHGAIGTTYGSGTGASVPATGIPRFKLPNYQQKFLVGENPSASGNFSDLSGVGGSSGYHAIDITGSSNDHVLDTTEIPAHKHNFNNQTGTGPNFIAFSRSDTNPSGVADTNTGYGEYRGNSNIADDRIITMADAGGGQGHSHTVNLVGNSSNKNESIGNLPPFVTTVWIIKVKKDNVADLSVTVDDLLECSSSTTHTSPTKTLGFDSKTLRLTPGHPVWGTNGHLYVEGNDIWMNTDGSSQHDTNRMTGRAVVAGLTISGTAGSDDASNSFFGTAKSGLVLNYDNDFSGISLKGPVKLEDLTKTNIRTAGGGSGTFSPASGARSAVTREFVYEIPVDGNGLNSGVLYFNSAGWENYGGSYSPFGFYKDCNGRVHLEGLIKSKGASGSTGHTIATLPAGYRPSHRKLFACTTNSAYAVVRIDVHTNGVIQYSRGGTTPSWLSLESISFLADGHPRQI